MKYNITLIHLINREMGSIKYFSNGQIPTAVSFFRSYQFCKQFTAKALYKHIIFFLKLKFPKDEEFEG